MTPSSGKHNSCYIRKLDNRCRFNMSEYSYEVKPMQCPEQLYRLSMI